jgi:hypothetical protein
MTELMRGVNTAKESGGSDGLFSLPRLALTDKQD